MARGGKTGCPKLSSIAAHDISSINPQTEKNIFSTKNQIV